MTDNLQRAIAAIKAGDNAIGKNLLVELLKADHKNEEAWLWMTRVVNSTDEKIKCLQNALVINPHNEYARQGLSRLRLPPPDKPSRSVQLEPSTSEPKQIPVAPLRPVSPLTSSSENPPSAPPPATRQCPYCAETIKAAARVCRYCGRDLVTGQTAAPVPIIQQAQPQIVVQAPPQQGWNPGIAAVLSFIIPGMGQIYKAQIGRGVLVFLMTAAGYALFVVPGIIMHLIAIVDASQGNPYGNTAQAKAPGSPPPASKPNSGANSGSGSGSNNFLIFTLLIIIGMVLFCGFIYMVVPGAG